MSKKMKKQKPQYARLVAFDIETNQYFDYHRWVQPGSYLKDKLPETWNMVRALTQDMAKAMPFDMIAGFEYARKVWDKFKAALDIYKETVSPEEDSLPIDELKWEFDTLLGANGDFGVIPVRSEVYLANFLSIDWFQHVKGSQNVVPWHRLPEDEFKELIQKTNATFCYNIDDIDQQLRDIEASTADGALPVVVLIHNLSYEVNNAFLNCPIFKTWIEEGRLSFLTNNTKDTYKSMDVYGFNNKGEVDRNKVLISFRDTWKLTGKSIKKVGDVHKYPKLDYEYETIRTFASLTQEDYDYNKRDCEISLLAAKDAYSQAWEVYEESKTFPVSANSIVSSLSKSKFNRAFMKHKKGLKDSARYLNEEAYTDYKPTTGGGLVCVCPEFAYTPIKVGRKIEGREITAIHHVDLISAHPSQAFKRLFPVSRPIKIDDASAVRSIKQTLDTTMMDVANMATEEGILRHMDVFSTLFSLSDKTARFNVGNKSFSGYATFTFYNVKVKTFRSSGLAFTLPTLATSKTVTKLSGTGESDLDEDVHYKGVNIVKYRGKLVSADKITMKLTFEDFLSNACLFYDFDKYSINGVHVYQMGYISEYLYQQFNVYGHRKNAYKKLAKGIQKHLSVDDIKDLASNEYINQNEGAMLVALCETGDYTTAYEEADKLLGVVKAQFNGVYGTSYQSLFRDAAVLQLNDDTDELEWVSGTKYDEDNNSGVDVLQGSYIAQWSRVDIALHMALCINYGAIPLYIATDSIYYAETNRTKSSLTNMIKNRVFNGQTDSLKKERPNGPDLGGMDFEPEIKGFAYTCSLKNCYIELIKDKDTGEFIERIDGAFSGCNKEIYFQNCVTFDDYARRLTQPDAYVSLFESHKPKKAWNDVEGCEVGNENSVGYVLQYMGMGFNKIDDGEYCDGIERAIYSPYHTSK